MILDIDKKIKLFWNTYNIFQQKILNILLPTLQKVDPSKVTESSFVDARKESLDIILNHKEDDSMVIFSIQKDIFKINSREFDYLFFEDLDYNQVLLLVENMLDGKFSLTKVISESGKVIEKKIEWANPDLKCYNQKKKSLATFFKSSVSEEKETFSSFF